MTKIEKLRRIPQFRQFEREVNRAIRRADAAGIGIAVRDWEKMRGSLPTRYRNNLRNTAANIIRAF